MKEYSFPEVTRNIYDVDAFELLDAMKARLLSNVDEMHQKIDQQLEMLNILEEDLIKEGEHFGFDILKNQKYRNFILPSSSNLYHTFLTFKLITFDLYKIGPMLSHQSESFSGNYYAKEDNFVGLVEYVVYEGVKSRIFSDENLRLEKIVNWVEDQKKKLPFVKSLVEKTDEETVDNKYFRGNKVFFETLNQKLSSYFENEKDKVNLYKALFTGEVEEKLEFKGQSNQFVEFFKRYRYNNKISYSENKDLTEWIYKNFKFWNRKSNKYEDFKNESILQILKAIKKEPNKIKRILIEIAPYKTQEDRKKDN